MAYFFLWIIEGFGVADFGVHIVLLVIGRYKKRDLRLIISIAFVGVVQPQQAPHLYKEVQQDAVAYVGVKNNKQE